jgi:hypothetical protein
MFGWKLRGEYWNAFCHGDWPRRRQSGAETMLKVAQQMLEDWAVGSQSLRDHNGQALAYVYFEDEPGRGARRPSCLPATGPGGSLRTSPSCRTC